MSRDPSVEGRRWVAQAESDLADARYLSEGGRYATACFLFQQAAEKALKGLLYAAGADAILGHGVRGLCEEVARVISRPVSCDGWAELDLYYIPTRYPDALPSGIPADSFSARHATGAEETAAEVVDFALRMLDE